MAYSELIKNFEKIRAYMRDFYVYGFRTRTDFEGKSARSYDNERRRIESWLGDSMSFRQDASGKSVFISVDNRETLHNPFYRALKAKSFTDKDITLHFYILDILEDGEKLPFRTIADRVSGCCQEIAGDAFLPDDSTIRNKLKEYVSLGILKEEKQGREVLYSRDALFWDMDRWKEALSFASEAMPLGAVGSFLLDKYPELPEYFSFKHHYLLGAMDSEILAELLSCRKEKKNALILFSTRRSKEETHQALVYPLKVYISARNGRENLLAYSFHARRPRMYRLDRIRSVKMMDAQPAPEELDRAGERFAEALWGTSAGPDRRRDLQELTMRIHAEKDEKYVIERLYREKRKGTVERLDETTWQFTVQVYDAMEMLPWIRTFTGRIESLDCTDPEVTKRFYGDLEEMYSVYGVMTVLFNEVYGSYYNVVAGILSEAVTGELSGERIRKIIEKKGYLESGISIPKALEKGKWPLLRKDCTTPVRHIPAMPLTTLQKQWMKAVCQDPRIRLFDPPLQDLEGVEPLFEPDFFVWPDRCSDGDPYEDSVYQEHFRLVLLALRENRGLRIRYRGRKYRHDQLYIPEKLEYSSKDDKFRLIAHSARGTPYMIRLASIREVSLAEKTAVREKKPVVQKETVVLELEDKRNALERAMIHFSDLEKETEKLDETHYRITLLYRKDDEKEILIRVLSFGPKVRVSSPGTFIDLIRERLQMQRRFKSCGP